MEPTTIESSNPDRARESPSDHLTAPPGQLDRVTGSPMYRELLKNPPSFHSGNDFRPAEAPILVNWGCRFETLDYIAQTVAPRDLTIETGAGLSTVVFTLCGANHISVSPSWQEHERIKDYCLAHEIPIANLRQVPRPSGDALPNLEEIVGERQLDFALIDGAHKFPYPVVDWFYVDRYLKVGGVLAIDDLQIPSVKMLHRFLLNEPAYKFERIVGIGTVAFRKVKRVQSTESDWESQPMNAVYPDWSHLPRREQIRQRLGQIPALVRAYRFIRGTL